MQMSTSTRPLEVETPPPSSWDVPSDDGLTCAADPFDDFDEDDFDDDFDDDFEEEWDDELPGDADVQTEFTRDDGADADFDD
jgi:hypothetical protein